MSERVLYLGLDSGSTASKCVIVDASGAVVSSGLYASGVGTTGPAAAVEAALAAAGATRDDVVASCSTGYGRKLVDWANWTVSELSCHAHAVAHALPGVRTVIDIGGQDAKVLRLDASGQLENFAMNDKCAAGTGRFLDVMASIFGCKVSELSGLDEQAQSVVTISSTCTVFAESEVISKMAAGCAIPDIVAGVHESVVERTAGLVRRVGVVPEVAMSGGVALNASLVRRLEGKLGCSIQVVPNAQMNGAFGAALYALEKSGAAKD